MLLRPRKSIYNNFQKKRSQRPPTFLNKNKHSPTKLVYGQSGFFNLNQEYFIYNKHIFKLKLFLKNKGYSFNSDTDTEVVCNLIEFLLQDGDDFEKALIKTLDKIEGSSSIVGINIKEPKKYSL